MTVCLVGMGQSTIAPELPHLTFKELIYEAVQAALADAGVTHREIDSALTAAEDFVEGRSIADEFTVDPLGAKLKPNDRICGDSLLAMLHGAMQIEAGIFDLVLVAGYEKGSETVIDRLDRMALDPFFEQPVVQRADLLAGLELTRLLHETGIDRRAIAHVAAKNRRAGRPSPFGRNLTADDVLASPVLASPVTTAEWAAFADGAVAVLLASEAKARELAARRGDQRAPVTLDGWGFAAETAWVNDKNYAALPALSVAAQKAYATAGVTDPASAFAFAELDDRYAHREVMGALALGLTTASRASAEILGGRFDADGALPINPSGGRLGGGDLFTGAGLRAVVEAAWALRRTGGEAVKREWSAGWQTCLAKPRTGASRALVATLFGPAGTNGAVAVLGGAAAKK